MPEYCVTGGSGFIATYLIKSLLEKGHNVKTTVRDPGKNFRFFSIRKFLHFGNGYCVIFQIFKFDYNLLFLFK